MDTTLQRRREDRMATKKQILVGFFIALTVFLMIFFMTSDYNFSVSFSANSHPLHLKEEETRGHAKYFGREEVEVAVYKGKEGDLVPDGLSTQGAGGPDRVVVINADEENIMEEIAEEMREDGGWMVDKTDREFPKIEMNHDVEAKPVQPTDDISTKALTTDQSTTTNETTETTTTTTTPPTTSTTTKTSSEATTNDRKRNNKVEVRRRKRDNLEGSTTNPPSAPLSTSSVTEPATSPQETTQSKTESISAVTVESSAPINLDTSSQSTGSHPIVVQTSTKTVSESGDVVVDFTTTAGDEQSTTNSPGFITSDSTTPNISDSKNITEQNVTASDSEKNTKFQINNHQDNSVVVVENNELPEEFLSDDGNNSDNSFV
ncbi:hypothetical protein ACHWQZ_G016202 [Mnemiopsis leidyi]